MTIEEILQKAVASVRGEARLKFRKYLDDITHDRFSDAELTRLWNSTPADIYLGGPGGPRAFFKLIRDRL